MNPTLPIVFVKYQDDIKNSIEKSNIFLLYLEKKERKKDFVFIIPVKQRVQYTWILVKQRETYSKQLSFIIQWVKGVTISSKYYHNIKIFESGNQVHDKNCLFYFDSFYVYTIPVYKEKHENNWFLL